MALQYIHIKKDKIHMYFYNKIHFSADVLQNLKYIIP